MKFVVIRSNFREAISLIERSSGEISNLPILKNILIRAGEGMITLMATNLEIAVTAGVAGKIIEDGTVTIPLSLLSNLINNLQSDRLNVEAKGALIEIKTDNYTATLQGLPADDFPVAPKIKDLSQYLEIKGILLKEALYQVMAAATVSDLRPELNSVFFNFSLEKLVLAATDGFRLGEKTIPGNSITNKGNESFKVLVPLKTAQEIARTVNNDEEVKIYHDENQILFKTPRMELISRLIEGNFPEYSQLIPEKTITEVIIERDEFANAAKLVSVFSQKNSEVEINIHEDKKTITIKSADQTLGENAYIVPAKIKGEAMDVVFNWRYLNDAIKIINTKEIFFGFQEDMSPSIIKPNGDISYFYILRPIAKS